MNSQNIEQSIGKLVTFMSEINLQKEKFLAKYDDLPTWIGMCICMPPRKS